MVLGNRWKENYKVFRDRNFVKIHQAMCKGPDFNNFPSSLELFRVIEDESSLPGDHKTEVIRESLLQKSSARPKSVIQNLFAR